LSSSTALTKAGRTLTYFAPDAASAPPASAEPAQSLALLAERFSVPELLFSPREAGVAQAGLAHAVAEAIAACPAPLRAGLWSSVTLVGGGAALPGLEARLFRELRALCPAGAPLGVFTARAPAECAWRGGSIAGCRPDLGALLVTKAEYTERGPAHLQLDARWNLRGRTSE